MLITTQTAVWLIVINNAGRVKNDTFLHVIKFIEIALIVKKELKQSK